MKCLQFEIDNKMLTGKLGYMKTMWKWLTQREWEVMEEMMQEEDNISQQNTYGYGTRII